MARWRRFVTTTAVLAAQVAAGGLLVSTLNGSRGPDVAAERDRGDTVAQPAVAPPSTPSTLAALPALSSSTSSTKPPTTTSRPAASTSSSSTSTSAPAPPPAAVPSTTATSAPTPGCSPPLAGQARAADVIGPQAVWVSGHSDPPEVPALQLTADGGRTWSPVCLPVSGPGSVARVAHRGERAWAVGSSGGAAFAARSADGGSTWTLGDLPRELVAMNDAVFVDGDRGWAVASLNASDRDGGAVVATSDGGVTWRRQSVPGGVALSTIDFADAGHGVAAGMGAGGPVILTTSDGGKGWAVASLSREAGSSGAISDVVLLGREGFAVGDAGILATFDGGSTWELRQAVAECCLAGLFFLDADHGWAVGGGTQGQVYRTSNAGWTWERQAANAGPPLQSVSFADALHGFALARQQPCLYSTEDGGTSWTGRRLDGAGNCPAA